MTPTDLELVNNIKTHCNVRYSLEELVNRHSGIYFEVINRMVPVSSTYCNRQELFEDRNFNIYTAALKYDETMGAKFSTFLGNETKWVCLNAYNQARKKPLVTKAPEDLDILGKDYETKILNDILLKEIYSLVAKHPDRRVAKIFHLRYKEGERNRVLAWKHIAPQVDLSIQGCILVHDTAINDLKRKLNIEKKL